MQESQLMAAGDVILGEGAFRYRVVRDWARLPDGWDFHEVAAVGIDAKDDVYVFNRGAHPMMVFDRAGNFLRAWGEDIFRTPTASTSRRTARSTAPMTVTTRCAA